MATPYSIHTTLLKMSNTSSPITLQRNALLPQNMAQMCSFKLYNFIIIFKSKSVLHASEFRCDVSANPQEYQGNDSK